MISLIILIKYGTNQVTFIIEMKKPENTQEVDQDLVLMIQV